MDPVATLIRVRQDGVPVLGDAAFRARFPDSGSAQFLEMPYPAKATAREFALAFLDAVSTARGEWVYLFGDDAHPGNGALAEALRRLRSADPAVQGAAMPALVLKADGSECRLFEDGFTLDAMETGKAAHAYLAEPAWLLSLFVLKLSFARALAEEWARTVDPLPAVLAFLAASKVAPALREGSFLALRGNFLAIDAPLAIEQAAGKAMADFEAGRDEAALRALDRIRFAYGPIPDIDLHRCVLAAKLERYWHASHMVRRFLRRHKGNPHGTKLLEALASRRTQMAVGYSAAEALLHAADPDGAFPGEKALFDLISGLHEQAVIVEIGEFPLRSSLAMALASLGTPRKIVTLSAFRARQGWKSECGAGMDIWRSAMSRCDAEDTLEATSAILERLRSWGDAPRPDVIYVSIHDDDSYREAIAEAFALLKTGGLLIVEGPDAGASAAWKLWAECAEPALEGKTRSPGLAFGRKGSLPLGGVKREVTFPELYRRASLPEPFERTMLSYERCRNAFTLARIADIRGLKGAIVECGVWKGGCSSAMLLAIQETGSGRHLWAFDSFEGLPRPTEKDGDWAFRKSDEWGGAGCEATEADFRETLFGIAGLKDENVHIRKGWFKDTMPGAKREIGPIAILRLDGDWYDSVLVCLEHLYDLVVPGGYILIDDYGYWEGARKATDEFRAARGITSPLIQTDHEERYWMKLEGNGGWAPAAVREAALDPRAVGKK